MDLYCIDKTTKEIAILSNCDERPQRLEGAEYDKEWDELKAERLASIKRSMVGRGHLEENLEAGWKTFAEIEVMKRESEAEFWASERNAQGVWASDVDAAKAKKRNESKLEARKLLVSQFDPHTARKQDDGTEIPDEVRTFKTSMLQAHEDHKTNINALGTKQEIKEMEFVWPTSPNV